MKNRDLTYIQTESEFGNGSKILLKKIRQLVFWTWQYQNSLYIQIENGSRNGSKISLKKIRQLVFPFSYFSERRLVNEYFRLVNEYFWLVNEYFRLVNEYFW
jgi:hypothetical protein